MHLSPPLFLPQLPTLHGFNKLRSQKSVDCTVAAAALFTDIIIFPQGLLFPKALATTVQSTNGYSYSGYSLL